MNSVLQQVITFFITVWIGLLSIFVNWGWITNDLVAGPTVFVVENEYQIIWETQQPSVAWVCVGGQVFTDNLAGNLVWDDTVHKVRVPMEALDAAKGYEINWQHILRSEWALHKGSQKAKKYDFRPIDTSDGIQIYHIADTHSNLQPGADTAKYWGDKLDLLILNGDIIHNPEFSSSRNFALKLAFEITRGTRPVLYARGNHEYRGGFANGLERYLGCPAGDRWYFTTRVGPLWIAVFDVAEMRPDDDEGYNGFADFASYRQKETAFFERVVANAEFDAPGVEVRLLVSHIPVGLIDGLGDVQARWADLANEMKIDLALSGHHHRVEYFPAGEYSSANGALNYPLIIGARPAHIESAQGVFIATAAEFTDGGINAWFTNQGKEVLREIAVLV
jgi:predicted phosphodiesterase